MTGLYLTDLQENMDALCAKTQGNRVPIPDKVQGRIAHIDGDYLAYIVSADRKDQPITTMAKARKHLAEFIEQLLTYSGSSDYVIHLTSGDKGGRAAQAKLKEYQENRDGKEVPVLLGDVRKFIATSDKSFVCTDGEADDSMAQALYQARISGNEHLAVLVSQDKDLNMVRGWHLDWMTSELYYVDDLGKLEVESKTKVRNGKQVTDKKVRGSGGLWFFCQLIQGDAADNISGLPKMVGSILNDIDPTKEISKAQAVLDNPKATAIARERARNTLAARKGKKCGQMVAYKYLKDCTTLKDAYMKAFVAYVAYDVQYGFEDYNGNKITALEAFESECRLLYMRHNMGSEDFREYLNWIMEGKLDASV